MLKPVTSVHLLLIRPCECFCSLLFSITPPSTPIPPIISYQVDLEGPFGFDPFEILSLLPSLEAINGVRTADMHAALSNNAASASAAATTAPSPGAGRPSSGGLCCLFPRREKCERREPIAERVMRAMWRHAMVYRLASESQLDDTPVW